MAYEEEAYGTQTTQVEQPGPGEGSLDAAAASTQNDVQPAVADSGAGDSAAAQAATAAADTDTEAETTTTSTSTSPAAADTARAAEDARTVRASLQEGEQRATRDTLRSVQDMDSMSGMLMIFQLLIAMFTGDTSLIDRGALSQFSTALGLGEDGLNNTVDRVARGEISGFRGAAETVARVNPSQVDYGAMSNIRVGDLINRNDGPTLLHPELMARMESDPTVRNYVEMTFDAAERHDLDGAMLANQFWQESRFNPNAVSPAGAVGIAQFMPQHRNLWGFSSQADFRNPELAIEGGARFMANQTAEYGSQSLALAAYNGGGGAIDYADRNVAGNGVTIDQWMGFMEERRAANPNGRAGLWQNETYNYVTKIDSQYWSPELIAQAQAANATALASIGREEETVALASAYRPEDNALREGLQLAGPMGNNNVTITSDFGPRDLSFSRMHHGIDFRTRQISSDGKVELHAQQPMTVVAMGHEPGFGNRLIVALGEDDEGRLITAQYAHLDTLPTHLTPGQVVEPGEYLVTTGSTGRITGPHLDYQVRIGAQTVNPELAFQTDLSDSDNGDRLIADARRVLGDRAASGTYNAMIAPAIQRSSVQQGLAQLERIQVEQEQLLLAQRAAAEEAERVAAAASEAAEETPAQVAAVGTGSSYDEAGIATPASAGDVTNDDLAPTEATAAVSLSTEFGSPDEPQGVDQVAVAATEEVDTAPEEVVLAANTTAGAPRLGGTTAV